MPPKKTEGAAPKAKSGAAHASYQVSSVAVRRPHAGIAFAVRVLIGS